MNKIITDTVMEQFERVIKITVSSPMKKEGYKRIALRPVNIGGENLFQAECFTEKQVFHTNIVKSELCAWIENNCDGFKQYVVLTENENITILCSSKGAAKVIRSSAKNKHVTQTNDRQKEYILKENMPVEVFYDLGICDKDGAPIKAMNKKLRQIDRFIRIMYDMLKDCTQEELTILDFGCGKSYLTFLCYHFLKEIMGKRVRIFGYDVNESTVELCRSLAEKYRFEGISFCVGNVFDDNLHNGKVDMIMSLHACDTATDATLFYAITHNVKYVLSVPCCQHEINSRIENGGDFDVLLKNGIIKDRFCAILTDSIRAELMKRCGYTTDVFEFVEFAHSPKNLMLRCKRSSIKKARLSDLKELLDKYGASQTLLNELEKYYLLDPSCPQ